MTFNYAILDENNICVSVVTYFQELRNVPENYVGIESGENVQWRKYENGQWSEEKYLPPESEPQPSIEEEILYENKYQTLLLEMGML